MFKKLSTLIVAICCLWQSSNAAKPEIKPPAFPGCVAVAFQTEADPDNNVPMRIESVNLLTGATSPSLHTYTNPDLSINAIGFNRVDNRIYGIVNSGAGGDRLIVIGSDYTYQTFPTTGYTFGKSVVGDVNSQGILYILTQGDQHVVKIDVNPNSNDFGKATDLGAIGTSDAGLDWAFRAGDDNNLYTVTGGQVKRLTLSNLGAGSATLHTISGATTGGYGAVYFDASNNFYAKANQDGKIYKITGIPSGPYSSSLFATSTAAQLNDGCRCPEADPPTDGIDFDDLPDTYKTFLGSNGARHTKTLVAGGTTPSIYMGASLDGEADGTPSPGANADNFDDGVSSFPVIAGGSPNPVNIPTYKVDVTVHNNTGSAATLYGWIDWNNNGTFESGERVSIAVPNGTNGVVSLTWSSVTLTKPANVPFVNGTYARFRLSTDAAAANPVGLASNGEVEGYYIPFTKPLPIELGGLEATISGNNLTINWQTLTETNVSHFDVEASSNGTDFVKIGEVDSKSLNGNSSQPLNYSLTVTKDKLPLLAGIGILGLAVSLLFFNRKNKLFSSLLLILGISILGVSSCNKQSDTVNINPDGKLSVRIVSVDKDGTKNYSKAVQARIKD